MSHATGKVKFTNGEVKSFEYDATVSYVCPRLHDSVDGVQEHWRADNRRKCTCGKHESVTLAVDYGGGIQWDGRACKHCMAITHGFTPYDDDVCNWDGLPNWWQNAEVCQP